MADTPRTTVPRALVEEMGGETAFRLRLTAFRNALADHAVTVDRPRPVELPVIENLAGLLETDWRIEAAPEAAAPFDPPVPPAPPAPLVTPAPVSEFPMDAIAPRALYLRIPQAARAAIRLAARNDPAGQLAELYDQLMVASRYVRLSDPLVVGGIQGLRAAGHLTEVELAAVLNPVVELEEKP